MVMVPTVVAREGRGARRGGKHGACCCFVCLGLSFTLWSGLIRI
jgi:hypothetical protein